MDKRKLDFIDACYADKDLSLLEKLTLIIPTYNRNYYLSRCLWYHAHFPFCQIIVADSSPEEKKIVNRETVAKIQNLFGTDILYLEYNPETEPYGGDIYRKWGDALQYVKTEYSQFCTDKEFLIPTSLEECISFLSENPEYVTAEGVVYQLRGDSNSEYYFTSWQDVPSVDQDGVDERLRTGYDRVTGTLFSVYRSEQHKKIYVNLLLYGVDDIRYGETALEVSPLFIGKIKKLQRYPGRIRDILNLRTERPLTTSTNLSESSFLRYPKIQDYPPDEALRLMSNLVDCLYSIVPIDRNSLLFHMEMIIKKRYYSGYSIFDKYLLVRKVWDTCPAWIQHIVKSCIGWEEDLSYSLSELGPEIQTIGHIIRNTQSYHTEDLSILSIHG